MKEVSYWQIPPEELRIIKLALLGKIRKRSPLWNKAQALAEQINIDVSSHEETEPNVGLTEEIIKALSILGSATVSEIAEYLDVPTNSVSSITSKLYKLREIEREPLPELPKEGRGLRSQYAYRLP